MSRRDVKTVDLSPDDRRMRKDKYKKPVRIGEKPRDQWITVPVPDAGIPLEVVEAARNAIKDNKRASSAGRRDFWELSGGILVCGECGRAMNAITLDKPATGNKKAQRYFYYACRSKYRDSGPDCSNTKTRRAEDLEARVSGFVTDLLTDAGKLTAHVDALIAKERRALADPDPEAKAWAAKLEECANRRAKYQQMFAANLMTIDELKANLQALDADRATAEKGLADVAERQERIEALERDKEALLHNYHERAQQGGMSEFTPEERHDMYKRMRLTVMVGPGGVPSVDAADFKPGAYRVDFEKQIVRGHHATDPLLVEGVVTAETPRVPGCASDPGWRQCGRRPRLLALRRRRRPRP